MASLPNRPNTSRTAQSVAAMGTTPTKPSSAFSKARENAQAAVGALAFYSGEAKTRLYRDLVPLWLHDASLQTGQFGEQWYLSVSENDPDAAIGTIALARNSYRDSLFGELEAGFTGDPAPIGPLMLSKVVTGKGQESWDLIEWTQVPF